jgi:hypothetical protein
VRDALQRAPDQHRSLSVVRQRALGGVIGLTPFAAEHHDPQQLSVVCFVVFFVDEVVLRVVIVVNP